MGVRNLREKALAWGAFKPNWATALRITAARQSLIGGFLKKRYAVRPLQSLGWIDIKISGLKFRCNTTDNGTERALVFSRPREYKKEIDLITDHLESGQTFVDIGANCGLFSLFAARRVGDAGVVVAVEPMPEMVARLRFNIAANGFRNIRVRDVALADKAGKSILYVKRSERGHSSIAWRPQDSEPIAVPAITFSELVADERLSRIDAMKIDVEGHEDRVIIPMLAEASRHVWPNRVLIETGNSRHWSIDCVRAMTERGYEVIWEGKYDCLLQLHGKRNASRFIRKRNAETEP